MYAADERVKELYRSDSIEKHFIAEFCHPGESVPFLAIYEGDRFFDMSMEESLSSDENLNFGSCEATQVKLTVIDLEGEIMGSEMTLYQTVDGLYPEKDLYPSGSLAPAGYIMPLGKYVVKSAEQQANRRYRDIVALDSMSKFDVNVTDWYNALPFPLTLRDFRARLCRHIGVTEHVPGYLPNDGMLVEKTVEAEQLMGRGILTACEQVNGVFGHFDRAGVLQHITLQPNYTLIPALDLYPSEDLYPVTPGEMNEQVYDERINRYLSITCQFEEYTARSIDTVQIRQEEGDIGAIYGTGRNTLIVEGNLLLYGKNADELQIIAGGIYGMVSNRQYIPYECNLKGLPYLEVGDTELIETQQGDIVTYIIKRTLKGISALKDTHGATGEETRSEQSNINTEIIQLKGKTAILKRNVNEVSAELTDLEKDTAAKFAITAEQISAEVKRAQDAEASLKIMAESITMSVKNLKENMESQFIQTAEQIALKVSIGGVTNSLNSELKITGHCIELTTGNFIINAKNLSVDEAGNAVFGGKIKGAELEGTLISSSEMFSVMDNGSSNYEIDCGGFAFYEADRVNIFADMIDETVGMADSGNVRLWIGGNHGNPNTYFDEEGEMYPGASWWKGWGITETMQDVYDRLNDLQDQIDNL